MPKTPRLREWRERAALSQGELAARSGTSRATIADLEAGNRGGQPKTIRRLAEALRIEPEDLYGEPTYPKEERRSSLEPSLFNGIEEERRLGYLRAWRAFVWKLAHRWEENPPESSEEIAVVLDTMQALVDEGAFGSPPGKITTSDWREASEGIELQALFLGLRRLNAIADTVKGDETAQQRRKLLEALPGGLSA